MSGGLQLAERLRAAIRDVPDFPREGILFKDLTTLFGDPVAFREAIDGLATAHRESDIEVVVGVESRGFVIGGALAYALGCGFVPVRKAGRLPGPTISVAYSLEYGESVLEIHADAPVRGRRVLVVDDLLATGGTAAATISLVSQLGGEVTGVAFVVELSALEGRRALAGSPHMALVTF